MSETFTAAALDRDAGADTEDRAADSAMRRARASIAFGRKRGYYRVLFEAGPVDPATFAELADVPLDRARAWLREQVEAGVLRVVDAPSGDGDELLLPGEHVPIVLGDRSEVDEHEFDGARTLLTEHRGELATVLDSELERRSVLVFTDQARLMRMA